MKYSDVFYIIIIVDTLPLVLSFAYLMYTVTKISICKTFGLIIVYSWFPNYSTFSRSWVPKHQSMLFRLGSTRYRGTSLHLMVSIVLVPV